MSKVFQSLQRRNLSERVVHQIGLSIMRNDFKPGDALASEPELSLQFNVSRPVMREALKMLSAKGLIESRPKTGTRVRPRGEWNFLDLEVIGWQYEIGPDRAFLEALCEVRLMFEPMAARLAAARATDDEIKAIEECYRRMEAGSRILPKLIFRLIYSSMLPFVQLPITKCCRRSPQLLLHHCK